MAVWPFYEWDFGWILDRWIMEILMVILRNPLVNIKKKQWKIMSYDIF